MLDLLRGDGPITVEGRYYSVKNLSLAPALPAELFPGVLISGSSPAGLAAAEAIGATPVKYPKPPGAEDVNDHPAAFGVRVGVIARERAADAWRIALERFPENRRGQIMHGVAMSTSDSHWHKQLSEHEHAGGPAAGSEDPDPYWLGPFQNYSTFCPYLVGSYSRVAAEIGQYVRLGCSTFILDIPPSQEELEHTGVVFEQVGAQGR
jgi:alkanesulfonate monooxygenase